jgi:hypothetical protein
MPADPLFQIGCAVIVAKVLAHAEEVAHAG